MAAKKKATLPQNAEALATAYYEAMRQTKVTAGLALADAEQVTARQRAEDEANGITPYLEEAEKTLEA